LADVTSEHLDDLPKSIGYLERLTKPTSSDLLWSAGMLVDIGAFARLADDKARLAHLPAAQRLLVAQALHDAGDTDRLCDVLAPLFVHLENARAAWSLMAPRSDAPQARAFFISLRAQQLGRADVPALLRPWLCLALAQERWVWQGIRPDMAQLEPVLKQVIWSETDTAWAGFVVSRAAQKPGAWPLRAARALCDCWPCDEPRLAAPLQLLLDDALGRGDARLAVALCRQVLALNSAACEAWLLQALKARVPHDEVCCLLQEQRTRTPHAEQCRRLDLHIVGLKLEAGLWSEAAEILDAQPPAARDGTYAELAYALGEAEHDTQRQIQAAQHGIEDAKALGHIGEVQRWSQTLAQTYIACDAPDKARSVLFELWTHNAAADGAFALWTKLAADMHDVNALQQALVDRLAQLDASAARQSAARLLTTAWAAMPGERHNAMQALGDALGADLDESSLMCVRHVYTDAHDSAGLGAWFVRFAQAKHLPQTMRQSAWCEAALIADDLGDAHAAQAHRLAAVQQGMQDAAHLDACLHYAQSIDAWPTHAAVYGVLMQRLEAQQPQAWQPLAYRVACYAAEPDKHSALEAQLSALERRTDASAHDIAVAHVDLALRSAACDLAAEAAEHWLCALQTPAPHPSWFRHAQQHLLDYGDSQMRARLAELAAAHLPMLEAQTHSAPKQTQAWWCALHAHALAFAPEGLGQSVLRYQHLVHAALPWAVWAALIDDVAQVLMQAKAIQELVQLYTALLVQAPDDAARAQLYWSIGCVKRDAQADTQGAQQAFTQACALYPTHWAGVPIPACNPTRIRRG
jgi:hypothetical protein